MSGFENIEDCPELPAHDLIEVIGPEFRRVFSYVDALGEDRPLGPQLLVYQLIHCHHDPLEAMATCVTLPVVQQVSVLVVAARNYDDWMFSISQRIS